MDLNQILSIIEKESSKNADEINTLIQQKKEELSGLISDIGAAHIVANELGVKLFHPVSGDRKIKDLSEGMGNVCLTGKVTRVFEPREFEKNDRKGAVGNLIMEDDTGAIRITFWNELCQQLERINIGDVLQIKGGYVKRNQMMDRNELHLNSRSAIAINPEGVTIDDTVPRIAIKDIQNEGQRIELFGTIINVFTPSYYEVCPQCNKRIHAQGESYQCQEHGMVEPSINVVVNMMLDDGAATIRVACFRQQAEQLIENIYELKGNEDGIEQQKVDLLGKMVIVQGRTVKNKMNNNIECIAASINKNVNPDEELKRLESQ